MLKTGSLTPPEAIFSCRHRLASPRGRSRLREIQMAPREIVRGTFKIIASVSCTHFVALETGWQSDMDELSEGLKDFANYAKCGVEQMDPEVVYACKEPVSGIWRRCRKIAEEPGALVVELIDLGGSLVVTKDQILFLSQLYKDWSIKAVDLFFDGYIAASGSSDCFKRLEEHLLNKTFQLAYLHERTGPLMRDCVRVQDMRLNGDSVLDELVQKGLLLKRQPPTSERVPPSTPGFERAITKSSNLSQGGFNSPRSPSMNIERSPYQVQPQIEGVKPMEVDMKVGRPPNSGLEAEWGEWSQQAQGTPTQNHRNSQQSADGWGSVGLARDDIGTEVWNKVDNTPCAYAPTEGWNDSGTETPSSNRSQAAWNVTDWSASPPKKASAAATAATPSPAVSTTPRGTSSPTTVTIIGSQSSAAQAAQIYRPRKSEDVFSDVNEWSRTSGGTHSNQDPSTPSLERLAISEDASKQCPNCNELSTKVNTNY